MPTISIQATDTLFFRDGRPFSMGDDSFAQGHFLPPPSVIYGAWRSACIANGLENNLHLDDLVKASETLYFRFMALQVGSSQYFPLPMDMIVPKQKGKSAFKTLALNLVSAPVHSNAKTPKILKSEHEGKTEDEPFLLDLLALENYLKCTVENLNVKKRSDFSTAEPKIGIGRDRDSNITDGGKLFRTQANRPAKVDAKGYIQRLRFLLDFDGLDMPDTGWLALGGERRAAIFEKAATVEISRPEIDKPIFKIYLATPAVFAAGWKPENLLEAHGLTLLAAALDRPVHVGGWDLDKNKPKPMLQCVPAGSVYYVQAENVDAAKKAAIAIHGFSISDNLNGINYQAQGFGIAYIGKTL